MAIRSESRVKNGKIVHRIRWQLFFLFITSAIGLLGIYVILMKKSDVTNVQVEEMELPDVGKECDSPPELKFVIAKEDDLESQVNASPILLKPKKK